MLSSGFCGRILVFGVLMPFFDLKAVGFVSCLLAGFVGSSTLLWAQPMPVSVYFNLETDSKVSLLLTSADGTVVRELLHASPRKAGANSAAWDGLDEAGQPVPAGSYKWKLLSTQGLKAEYLMSVGTNSTPGWESWPGNHGSGCIVAVEGESMYVGTGCGEGTALAIKQTLDGKRQWTIPHWLDAWVGPGSMAADGGQLFMLQINGRLRRADAATGQPNALWDVGFEDDRKASVFGEFSTITDLDAGAGQLVVSYQRQNLVRWLDPKTGEEIDRATVPRPAGVAIDKADGSLVVISDGQVIRLSRADKTPKVIIEKQNLEGPFRLSVAPTSREILVAENAGVCLWVQDQYFAAKPLDPASQPALNKYYRKQKMPGIDPTKGQQIKRFSADGKPLAAYGKAGGRTYGNYDPADYSGLYDVAATADGGFVIGEQDAVRRTALFDANGKFVREWFGGWCYGQYAATDPADPTILWFPTGTTMMKTQFDLAAKSWKVLASYDLTVVPNWFGEDSQYWRTLRRNGTTYMARNGRYACEGPIVLKIDEKNGKLIPAAVGNIDIGQSREFKIPKATQPVLAEALEGKPNQSSYVWADRDGNGEPSVGEFNIIPWYSHGLAFEVDDEFNYYYCGQDDALKEVGLFKLPVVEWTPGGAPVYDFAKRERVAKSPVFSEGLWRDKDGSFFTFTNTTGLNDRKFGMGFWSPRASANRVSKFTPDGKPLWTVGRHAASSEAEPGEAKYLYTFTGIAHGCAVVNDVEESMMHVWDQDGLWVGRLLENPVIGPDSPKSVYELCGENFGGSLYTDPKTGEVLFYGGGINNVPIYKITGWDQFKRQSGQVEVSPELAQTLQAKAKSEAAREDVVRVAAIEPRSLNIDGDLAEWKDIKPLEIKDGKKTLAKVYVAWTPEGLVAAFDVATDSPWKSAGSEQLPFQGGSAVDINIGMIEPARKLPGDGDVRVVVAPISGKTTAVEILPKLAKGMSPPHTMREATYKTMIGSITYDRVAALDPQWSAAKPKADGKGYTVEMRIPQHPPFALKPGLRFRFDASVILASPDGTKSVSRTPWHSRAAEDMAVQDTYLEGLLRPTNWGEAVLE